MHRGSGLDQRCMRNPRRQTERSQKLGHGSQSDDRVVNCPPRLKKNDSWVTSWPHGVVQIDMLLLKLKKDTPC